MYSPDSIFFKSHIFQKLALIIEEKKKVFIIAEEMEKKGEGVEEKVIKTKEEGVTNIELEQKDADKVPIVQEKKEGGKVMKKKHSTLGPKGLRRTSGKNIYQGSKLATNYSRRPLDGRLEEKQVGGIAAFFREDVKMKKRGYHWFPSSFEPLSFSNKETFQFVVPGNYPGLLVSKSCNYYELANFNHEEKEVFGETINPFTQGTPCGEKNPLPRYYFLN